MDIVRAKIYVGHFWDLKSIPYFQFVQIWMSVASSQNLVPTTTLNASIAWGVLIVCVRRASLKSIESVFVSTLVEGLLAYFVFALPLCTLEDGSYGPLEAVA